jgi:predicted DCC family thiol-disulfide oxidoreductase YuxK
MYDSHCGLCTGVRDWLRIQPSYLDLRLMASDSEEARRMFPGLPSGELAVVSNDGQVWLGDNAFIVCLWALRKYVDGQEGWPHQFFGPWPDRPLKQSPEIGKASPAFFA